MDLPDEELVLRFQGGDESAFEAMVARWNEPILQLATRLTGDLEEAKDVRQMALLKTYQGIGGFEGRARFSTWIYRVVLNLCRDKKRGNAARARIEASVREREGDYLLEETGFHVARDRELAPDGGASAARAAGHQARGRGPAPLPRAPLPDDRRDPRRARDAREVAHVARALPPARALAALET